MNFEMNYEWEKMLLSNRIILHAFQWELRRVIDNLDKISKSGYNAVQISPISPTKDENNSEFWMLYQPIDFTVGNKQIGSREDLVKLCEKASSYGIEIKQMNKIFRPTIAIYNNAISFCVECFENEWNDIVLLDTIQRKQFVYSHWYNSL